MIARPGLWFLAEGDGGGAGAGGAGGGAGGAGAGTGGGAGADGGEKMIPKSRLDAESAKRRAAEAKVAELTPAGDELAKLRGKADAWKAERSALEGQLALARVGVVDEEHAADLSAAFGRLPEDGRPADAATYWRELQDKPIDEWPRALRGYGPTAAGTPATDPEGKTKPAKLPAGGAGPTGGNSEAAALATLTAATARLAKANTPENRKATQDARAALLAVQAAKTAR